MGFFRKRVATFFVTDRCNMSCIYCTVQSAQKKTSEHSKPIDLNFAKIGIDDYFGNGFFRDSEKKGIRIFGNGEPTIEFDTIRQIVAYACQKACRNLFVEMQTNGYFSEEVAAWIAENVDLVWFSLDGLSEIQNLQRPTREGRPSFAVIDRNIRSIAKSRKTRIGLRPTTTAYSVGRQEELIDYAHERGISTIYTDPWAYYLGAVDGQPKLRTFADSYLKAWEYARERNIYYGTIFTVNFDEEVEIFCRSCLPAPQFTPDGLVTCCDMAFDKGALLTNLFPEVILGRYIEGENRIEYYPEHIEKMRSRNIRNLPTECQRCAALKHCAGGCIGSAMTYSGSFYGVNREYCAVTKYLFVRMREVVNRGYDASVPIHP